MHVSIPTQLTATGEVALDVNTFQARQAAARAADRSARESERCGRPRCQGP